MYTTITQVDILYRYTVYIENVSICSIFLDVFIFDIFLSQFKYSRMIIHISQGERSSLLDIYMIFLT